MKKILDIIIIVLLTVLVMNFFFGKEKQTLKDTLIFQSKMASYTVPAGVILSVNNTQTKEVAFNTCNDIHVMHSGTGIELSKITKNCQNIIIKAGETKDISYPDTYTYFKDEGEYVFQAKVEGKEYLATFKIENPGTIRKLFTTLFYGPIYNLLIFLTLFFNYSLGLGILSVTVILRLLLIWPQHRMMISQRKLQTLQPKIKALQEEYKGQQQIIGMKLLELYKKENVNPMASFGFLFLQMPILIVIYRIIFSITDPSNYYYVYQSLASFNIDLLDHSFLGMDLLKGGGTQGVILAVLVGVIQFLQVKLSLVNQKNAQKGVVLEKKQGDDAYSQMMPDPEMMNKIMLYGMPVMVAVFTYSLFAGVGFYWLVSTAFMICQQIVVNRVSKK